MATCNYTYVGECLFEQSLVLFDSFDDDTYCCQYVLDSDASQLSQQDLYAKIKIVRDLNIASMVSDYVFVLIAGCVFFGLWGTHQFEKSKNYTLIITTIGSLIDIAITFSIVGVISQHDLIGTVYALYENQCYSREIDPTLLELQNQFETVLILDTVEGVLDIISLCIVGAGCYATRGCGETSSKYISDTHSDQDRKSCTASEGIHTFMFAVFDVAIISINVYLFVLPSYYTFVSAYENTDYLCFESMTSHTTTTTMSPETTTTTNNPETTTTNIQNAKDAFYGEWIHYIEKNPIIAAAAGGGLFLFCCMACVLFYERYRQNRTDKEQLQKYNSEDHVEMGQGARPLATVVGATFESKSQPEIKQGEYDEDVYSVQFTEKPFGITFGGSKKDKDNLLVQGIDDGSAGAKLNVIVGSTIVRFENERVEGLGPKKIFKIFKGKYADMLPLRITFRKPQNLEEGDGSDDGYEYYEEKPQNLEKSYGVENKANGRYEPPAEEYAEEIVIKIHNENYLKNQGYFYPNGADFPSPPGPEYDREYEYSD